MDWIIAHDTLIAEATAIEAAAKIKFPIGCRCIGGIRAHRAVEALRVKAWRMVADHQFGPPRFNTKRFEMFLVLDK